MSGRYLCVQLSMVCCARLGHCLRQVEFALFGGTNKSYIMCVSAIHLCSLNFMMGCCDLVKNVLCGAF